MLFSGLSSSATLWRNLSSSSVTLRTSLRPRWRERRPLPLDLRHLIFRGIAHILQELPKGASILIRLSAHN